MNKKNIYNIKFQIKFFQTIILSFSVIKNILFQHIGYALKISIDESVSFIK